MEKWNQEEGSFLSPDESVFEPRHIPGRNNYESGYMPLQKRSKPFLGNGEFMKGQLRQVQKLKEYIYEPQAQENEQYNEIQDPEKLLPQTIAKMIGQIAVQGGRPLNYDIPAPSRRWQRSSIINPYPAFMQPERKAPPTIEDLPEMALPVLEFMDQVKPHIVVGCDRGGRLFSLAMHATWREMHKDQPFPTLDGKIHFTRVSKSESELELQKQMDTIVAQSKKHGTRRGNTVAEDEQLRILFVDDWVIGGGTKRLTERLAARHNAQSFFAVMVGGGADVSGRPSSGIDGLGWNDDSNEVGVNYFSPFSNLPDGSWNERLRAFTCA